MQDDINPNAGRPGGNGQGSEAWREAELQRLVAEIAARLRNVCADLSHDEFAKLVLDIARTRQRFDAMDAATRPDRESPG